MKMKPDQTRVGALLIDTVSLLCRNGLNFSKDIKVQGLLGITVDGTDIFLVHFNETFIENEATTQNGAQQTKSEATSEPEVILEPSENQGDEKFVTEKSGVRKSAFRMSTLQRHKYSNLSLNSNARRRLRQFGAPVSQRTRIYHKPLEECADANIFNDDISPNDAVEDEKLECSIKTEKSDEDVLQQTSEEQDDVILVDSEDGPEQQGDVVPPNVDSGSYVKMEDMSEFSDGTGALMYSYDNAYGNFDSERMNDGEGSSGYSHMSPFGSSDDVKPGFQMPASAETWTGAPQVEWHSAQSSHSLAPKYGHRPMIPPHNSQNQKIDVSSSFITSKSTISSHNFQQQMVDGSNERAFLHSGRPTVSQNTTSRQNQPVRSNLDGWAANTGTLMSFVCRLCGATMRHRRSLLRHQINAHGRQKQKRGRPPIFSSPMMSDLP